MSSAYRGRNAQVWSKLPNGAVDFGVTGLQIDKQQSAPTELQQDRVLLNSAAAIALLRQHFAEPADKGHESVQHVLSTINRLHDSLELSAPPHRSDGKVEHLVAMLTSSADLSAKKMIAEISKYDPAQTQTQREPSAIVVSHGIRDPSGDLANMTSAPETLSPPPDANLNAKQRETFDMVTRWYVARQCYRLNPSGSPCPDPLLLLVHGGPGTGKSHIAKSLASVLPRGSVSFTATTGVAAAALPDGRTLHNLLSLPLVDGKFADLTPKTRDAIEKNLGLDDDGELSTCLLVVDEVSMMTATQLAFIDHRLREVGKRKQPFAGLAVLLMGDFYQLPPVGTEALYRSALAHHRPKATARAAARQAGAELFKLFRLIELTEQMRAAACPTQKHLVDNLRERTKPIQKEDLAKLKILTNADIEEDSTWLNATIVTPGNNVRHAINQDKVVRLAKRLGVPVLRWKLPLADASASNYPPELLDVVYDQSPEAWGYFVHTSPVYLDFNFNPKLGLANGTACQQHSITLDASTTDLGEVERDCALSKPGDFITIPVPQAVNVKLIGHGAEHYPADAPSFNNARPPIIPVPGKGKTIFTFGPNIVDGRRHQKSRALLASTSGFELGFGVTFHKMQGKTVDKIILCLNKTPRSLGTLTCAGLYVGLTRVRRNADMRVFPPPPGQTLDHLCELKVDQALAEWRQRYDKNGRWMEKEEVAKDTVRQKQPAQQGQQ